MRRRKEITGVTRKKVIHRDKRICAICGKRIYKPERVSLDHIIPVSRGGKHGPKNLQSSHAACNSAKSSHINGDRPYP